MTNRAPATLAGLDPVTWQDFLRVAGQPGLDRWTEQVRRTGGCSDPIHLTGYTKTMDRATGHVLHAYSTDAEPGGRLRVACGNRRASRCPACAWTYAGDTYHLIRAGLTGDPDKGMPHTVREHPRVFATLTAPSFGPVHNRPASGRCRCGAQHPEDAPALGTALDPGTYDYAGAVLWNNHASDLWRYFTIYLRRDIAARAGLTQAEARRQARISFGKVAEYQKRGAVHFHAVIRFDGPDGPDSPPPAWATLDRARARRRTLPRPRPALGHPARRPAHRGLRPRRGHRAGGSGVRGQVRHQSSRDHRHRRPPVRRARRTRQAPGAARSRPVADPSVLGPRRALLGPEAVGLGSHARLPGPLLHQEPPLLDHPGGAAAGPGGLPRPPRTLRARPARPGRRTRGHHTRARPLGLRRPRPWATG